MIEIKMENEWGRGKDIRKRRTRNRRNIPPDKLESLLWVLEMETDNSMRKNQ